MITATEIKTIRSLREKKFREKLGLFTVEGEKMVQEALASGMEVVSVWRASEIGMENMAKISSLTTPSPVLAVVRIPENPIAAVPESGLHLALDSVRDPGNLGTIVRLADWFGIDTIFASKDTVELYNPKVVQATMGAIFRKKLIYCDLEDLCKGFVKAGIPVYGTFLEGENIYKEELSKDALIVMGNESNGISDKIKDLVTNKIHIPSFTNGLPTAESLNVAIATAVTISEFRRR